jgi:carboxymethylenebutenolidase
MIGLSAGGHIAFYAATRIPLTALVVFYPGWLTSTEIGLSRPEPVLDSAAGIAALGTSMLMLAGADDAHELIVYPGTPHGFACPERDSYRPQEAADAWRRTFGLLSEQFGTRNNPLVH